MPPNNQQLNALVGHLSCRLNYAINAIHPISGGNINASYHISDNQDAHFFLKVHTSKNAEMLYQEKHNIHILRQPECIIIPRCIDSGIFDQFCYLLLEHIHMQRDGSEQQLGTQLAQLHRYHSKNQNELYGFTNNNYIGSTLQYNHWTQCWTTFWIEQRLKPQLELSYHNGFSSLRPFETTLLQAVKIILEHHQPKPSLLHGDLWSGNKAYTKTGQPIIFDPACYYGDRETDIAMTELFGGFGPVFYRAYNEKYPLDKGYQQRKIIYNLYHQLNHVNLFGEPYLGCCSQAIKTIIENSHQQAAH